VAWIAERKDVLSTFFELLTLLWYEAWARTRRPSRYLAVLLFFACALMAKPMAVTLPFVLLLLDYWPLQDIPSGLFCGKSVRCWRCPLPPLCSP
jgi:hypothetical protein